MRTKSMLITMVVAIVFVTAYRFVFRSAPLDEIETTQCSVPEE